MKLSSRLRRRFGLDPATFVALSGGEGHATFRSDELVVRFELAPVDELRWQYALVRFLSESVPEVIAPLAVEDGVSVWPRVAGRHARRRSREDALSAADLLRRLHQAGRRWDGGQRPRARTTAGEGERGPIHGDFYGRNIAMRRRAVVGLFDWEESCVDLLDYELANTVWEFCNSKRTHDFDRSLAGEMMTVYGSRKSPEDLVPLILVRRRIELATSDGAYRHHTQRAIENLSGQDA